MYEDFTLLIDGSSAFKEIIKCIDNAKKYIKINMFIWRDDNIGNRIAQSVLNAAKRGVKIEISKDRYGVVLEKSEENKKSFFHKKQNIIEKIKSKSLEIIYPMENTHRKVKDEESNLYVQIMNHPNIEIVEYIFKADHSKYYIIDDILILGGINIEDKENGKDMQGRVYQDYMIKLDGKKYVDDFLIKYADGINNSNDYFYGANIKKNKKKYIFEMEQLYLDMIKNTKKELLITMAYFSSINSFIEEIKNAYVRGVKVNIMIPNSANYQDDTNKKTVKKLMKLTNNGINVYFSKKMVHTKMIINDQYITFGSTNITKKAFNSLSELNIFLKNIDSQLRTHLISSVSENYKEAIKVNTYKEIKYNKIKATLESLII